ncbi:MAG: Isocitrate dehydrogenase [NADP] [Chlamydiales bacterium]|nr:Isocitrate dehydrogenase [NADP] [Chlamydiales bacterium]MCH9635607.1 Isocitrate dehydrogenase [NADP] [Chlamydiales bacterium]MCH9703871.1 NADP-dependent isocitrate dehydrogenase [Chlamydiota bacterium]
MTKITVAKGDGIGPEIMDATLYTLEQAGAALEIEEVAIGEKVYLAGNQAGIDQDAWDSLARTKVFLKAPITTPQGGGYRSLNVTVRGRLGLYANVRPCISYSPFITTKHPEMDVVVVRENEEDLYIGVEYQQTPDCYSATKLISRAGTEKICRYAFEYAKQYGRKKVTCFTKDNILKISDGHFHKIFDKIGKEYPDIEKEHWIIDIGAALLADQPERFDVVVMPNLYGDILSDIAAQITGSVGLVGTANIGEGGAMFEAIHGSAPDIAGQNIANPTGLILASVLMLVHIGQSEAATRLHNAWLKTIEDGVHTPDIASSITTKKVGTKEFAQEVGSRMGQNPTKLKAVAYESAKSAWRHHNFTPSEPKRECCGVDITVYSNEPLEQIVPKLQKGHPNLTKIFNRGLQVWPNVEHQSTLIDQWRCRFEGSVDLAALLGELDLDIVKIEKLYRFDAKPSYSNT